MYSYNHISRIHILIYRYMNTQTNAFMHACMHAYIHTYVCIHTYIHTYMHSCMHTYNHTTNLHATPTHTHLPPPSLTHTFYTPAAVLARWPPTPWIERLRPSALCVTFSPAALALCSKRKSVLRTKEEQKRNFIKY